MGRWQGLIGLIVLIGIGWVFSHARRRIRWRIVIGGVLLQVVLGLLVLRVPWVASGFEAVAAFATRVLSFTDAGAGYIFGPLYDPSKVGFIFAFKVLPTIIFFASLMAVLYHLKIMQMVVWLLSVVMNKVMGVSGAESLAVAANVFVGQTEAPLVVRPYVPKMTTSELMTLMVGGFATIAGAVFAAYVTMLGGEDPTAKIMFAKHLLTASIMSAPAAFVVSKMLVPETEESQTSGVHHAEFESPSINVLDAATAGASDGLRLAANVGAMLLALLSLIAALDFVLGWIGSWAYVSDAVAAAGMDELSLKNILGLVFSPLAWTMGVHGEDVRQVGSLLGEKLVLTEFIAYDSLGHLIHEGGLTSERSQIIAAYALCGFANFGSVAIQLGGIGGIAPTRRQELAKLGLKAMFGGAMASFMTATIAGIMVV